MGLHVGNAGTLGATDAIECTDLIMQQVTDFFGTAGHGTTTEACQVLIGRMGTNAYVAGHSQGHRFAHDARITGMETAGDIGTVDKGHDLGIQAHGPTAETFTHIAIQ
ncbi:hypothetical protein D3C77_557660 [compost metagenome]